MTMVSVGDVDIYVGEAGEGDPVVLHPGLGYASWCWQPLMARLSQQFRVIAVDTRGAGRSSKPDGPYSIDTFANDLAAVVRQLDATPTHIVGHSMGGFVAQRFAALHPELARTITLISTHPGKPGAIGVPEETIALWKETSTLDAESYARATFANSFRTGWAEANPTRFDELLAARLEFPTPPERLKDRFDAGFEFSETEWATSEIQTPVLVAQGTDDKVVPVGNAELLMGRLPKARLAIFEGAGHNLPLEQSQELAELLVDFWAGY